MPALSHPENPSPIDLPPRKAKLIAETDVLVVGGGLSGIGAAVGAADAGASVILVEEFGFLGGHATAALVNSMAFFYTNRAVLNPSEEVALFPQDHGPGEPVIGGVLTRFVNRLVEMGGALPPSEQTGYVVPFDPEIFKIAADEILDKSGVKFLFHSFVSGVLGDKTVAGVILETKSGPLVIKAKVAIDCTGDGDVAAMAGAPYEIGRSEDGLTQPMTLMFRLLGFNRDKFAEYIKGHPNQWAGVQGLRQLIQKATEAGKLNLSRENILLFGTPHEAELNINSTRITRVLGVDVWDLTYAEYMGRQQMKQIAAFLREYVPGFQESYIGQSGAQVGVRESRRIMGEYQLTEDDIVKAHKFDDVIARGTYPIDLHNPDGQGTTMKRLPYDEAYDIPLRCLIPKNVEQLLVAGRCISGTHEAQGSYRVMPISMATGQAAGICAALSAKQGKSPRSLPYQEVQRELLRQGANLRDIKMASII